MIDVRRKNTATNDLQHMREKETVKTSATNQLLEMKFKIAGRVHQRARLRRIELIAKIHDNNSACTHIQSAHTQMTLQSTMHVGDEYNWLH